MSALLVQQFQMWPVRSPISHLVTEIGWVS